MFKVSYVLQGEDQIWFVVEFFFVISVNYVVDEEVYLGELLQFVDFGFDGIEVICCNVCVLIEIVCSWDNVVDIFDVFLC